MLTSTFIHAPGIGLQTERKIWESGIYSWEKYLAKHETLDIAKSKKALIYPCIEESVRRLGAKDHRYFASVLPAGEHWRAVGEFGDKLGYLDIETTGCNRDDTITVIGLYDGTEMHTFVQGKNLEDFPEAVSHYNMLVTFFGSGFDLPVIRRAFPGIDLSHLHIDLCHVMRRLGFTGGLKHIEHELGINRSEETDGMSGFDAVRLWHEYKRGSTEALELLLHYNREDVVNMQNLLGYACRGMLDKLMPPNTARP